MRVGMEKGRGRKGRSGKNGGGWQKETRSWALNIEKWEDGQRRRGKRDSSGNEPTDARRGAAPGALSTGRGPGCVGSGLRER